MKSFSFLNEESESSSQIYLQTTLLYIKYCCISHLLLNIFTIFLLLTLKVSEISYYISISTFILIFFLLGLKYKENYVLIIKVFTNWSRILLIISAFDLYLFEFKELKEKDRFKLYFKLLELFLITARFLFYFVIMISLKFDCKNISDQLKPRRRSSSFTELHKCK